MVHVPSCPVLLWRASKLTCTRLTRTKHFSPFEVDQADLIERLRRSHSEAVLDPCYVDFPTVARYVIEFERDGEEHVCEIQPNHTVVDDVGYAVPHESAWRVMEELAALFEGTQRRVAG